MLLEVKINIEPLWTAEFLELCMDGNTTVCFIFQTLQELKI